MTDDPVAHSPERRPTSRLALRPFVPQRESAPFRRPRDLISDRLGGYVPVTTRRARPPAALRRPHSGAAGRLPRCARPLRSCRRRGSRRRGQPRYRLQSSQSRRGPCLRARLGRGDADFARAGRATSSTRACLNGVVDRIYRNGELWGERHRHDNRLAMAVLTRLDRQCDGLGEGAATARIVAQEWDQFLDIVEDGGDGAGDFLATRAAKCPHLCGAKRRSTAAERSGPPRDRGSLPLPREVRAPLRLFHVRRQASTARPT